MNSVPISKSPSPTLQLYSELQQAFDHFNRVLFDSRLPECIITLQRESKTYGYYSVQRFIKHDGRKIDEIAMNPEYFAVRTIPETLSTLVHEMVHLQQQHLGAPGRGRYHNHEWANWMELIGLMPSNTGAIGGKRTGDRVSHYIIQGAKFDGACKLLLTQEYKLSWMDRFPPARSFINAVEKLKVSAINSEIGGDLTDNPIVSGGEIQPVDALLGSQLIGTEIPIPNEPVGAVSNRSNREKYSCPGCHIHVWGKPELNILCGDCQLPLKINNSL